MCPVPLGQASARWKEARVVPEEPDPEGVQVLRAADHLRLRTRRHLRRRPQRLRQVERRRRSGLGDGGAGRQDPPRRQDGGRHLRGHVDPRPARSRRGHAHHRQLRRRPADRVHRGHDQPHPVPQRIERVRDQRAGLPSPRRPGAPERLRPRPRDARDRRPGPARRRAAREPRGASRLHRGGRRNPQAPSPQGEDRAQARGDADQPHAPLRPRRRDPPPAEATRSPGGDRP